MLGAAELAVFFWSKNGFFFCMTFFSTDEATKNIRKTHTQQFVCVFLVYWVYAPTCIPWDYCPSMLTGKCLSKVGKYEANLHRGSAIVRCKVSVLPVVKRG